MVDRLVRGGLMKQIFTAAVELLDKVTKISKSWYTYKDYGSIARSRIFEEQLAK